MTIGDESCLEGIIYSTLTGEKNTTCLIAKDFVFPLNAEHPSECPTGSINVYLHYLVNKKLGRNLCRVEFPHPSGFVTLF